MESEDDFLNIAIDSEEDESTKKEQVKKVPRDFLSEEDFERTRREWSAKIEAGEVSLCLVLEGVLLGVNGFVDLEDVKSASG